MSATAIVAIATSAEPDDVRVKVELTMSVGQWRKLLGQLDRTKSPAWHVSAAIREAIQKFTESHAATLEYSR